MEINGMTLEEIEEQMKMFKKMERANRRDFNKNCPIKCFPDPVFFTPREEFDFADRMLDAMWKAAEECNEAIASETDEEKRKELIDLNMRLFDAAMDLDRAKNEPNCFGGVFIWNKGDAEEIENGLKHREEECCKDSEKDDE